MKNADIGKTTIQSDYVVASLGSKDGTRIGYRRYGSGAAVVLVQAAMATTHNYHDLAKNLADTFTVYVPERRGRGLSAREYSADHVIDRDLEDLEAVLARSGAAFLFGMSSGAVIALEAARVFASIRKLALYEAPLFVPPREMRLDLVARYNKEVEAGDMAAAAVTAVKTARGPSFLDHIPRALIERIVAQILRRQDSQGTGDYAPLRELVPTMRYDFNVVVSMQGKFETFGSVTSDVLLLSGSKSPQYLRDSSVALNQVLPSSRRIEFKGLGHSAPWNVDRGGRPDAVATAMRDFFES